MRKIAGIVKESSPEAIVTAAARLDPHLLAKSWLAANNHFLAHSAAKVDARMEGRNKDRAVALSPGSVHGMQLAEFVAASVVLHCADGWAYLGRAMGAQLGGDTGASGHLSYYAELRAAMSLLASQGIGVFNQNHVIVHSNGKVDVFRQQGTHRFVWDALEAWSASDRSSAVVTSMVRPAGASLGQWYAAFTSGAKAKFKGDEYLRLWGLDIQRFAQDQSARGEASYRPRTATGCKPPASARAAEFGAALWRALEPDGNAPFGIVDLHLLRRTLEVAFRERTQKKPVNDPDLYLEYIQHAIDELPLSVPSSRLEPFLKREVDPADIEILTAAENMAEMDDPEHHLHMLARAALLLRLSTGCAKELIENASLDYESFEWWSDQLASARALVVPGELPAEPAELWEDVEQALIDLNEELSEGAGTDYATLHQRCSRQLGLLGGCERIALIGLAA
ncbi:MAG: hypothetical protein QOH76_3878 [Thermoleophilaceae bacterium]|jgi:hypothetical protein|nr:hypothetical protein [Thermoleophilaceae bacterium]